MRVCVAACVAVCAEAGLCVSAAYMVRHGMNGMLNIEYIADWTLCMHCTGRCTAAINEVRTRGESCGGEVTCVVRGCPKGLGSPVFDKLEAELAKAMLSLPATKVGAQGWKHKA